MSGLSSLSDRAYRLRDVLVNHTLISKVGVADLFEERLARVCACTVDELRVAFVELEDAGEVLRDHEALQVAVGPAVARVQWRNRAHATAGVRAFREVTSRLLVPFLWSHLDADGRAVVGDSINECPSRATTSATPSAPLVARDSGESEGPSLPPPAPAPPAPPAPAPPAPSATGAPLVESEPEAEVSVGPVRPVVDGDAVAAAAIELLVDIEMEDTGRAKAGSPSPIRSERSYRYVIRRRIEDEEGTAIRTLVGWHPHRTPAQIAAMHRFRSVQLDAEFESDGEVHRIESVPFDQAAMEET